MNREQAIEIARACAKAKPQSYYAEPFEPHEWVVDAILQAAGTSEPKHGSPTTEAEGRERVESLLDALIGTIDARETDLPLILVTAELFVLSVCANAGAPLGLFLQRVAQRAKAIIEQQRGGLVIVDANGRPR